MENQKNITALEKKEKECMEVKSENKMRAKQHSALWEGHRINQRSKDVAQETFIKKALDVSQANSVANNKK